MSAPRGIRVLVIEAWPRRFRQVELTLPPGACVRDALQAVGCDADSACAVYGQRVAPEAPLEDGDRVEVLRPLLADPKEARRRRVEARRAARPR